MAGKFDALVYHFHKVCRVSTLEKFVAKPCKVGCSCMDEECDNVYRKIECPSTCKSCQNQHFRRQDRPATEVRAIGSKEQGLIATQFISKGSFILDFVGLVITLEEAEHRKKRNEEKGLTSYMFRGGDFVIDSAHYGNKSRFINHLCDPNTIAEEWRLTGKPRNFRAIGFFASKDIKAGDEVTLDYGDIYGPSIACRCGSNNCSGFIGRAKDGSQKKTQKRLAGNKVTPHTAKKVKTSIN